MNNNEYQFYTVKPVSYNLNPKQGDDYAVGFNYKPLFLKGYGMHDNITKSTNYNLGFEIPMLEKYNLGIGLTGYDANYETNKGTEDSAGTAPYISFGYNNIDAKTGSGLFAGVRYQDGQQPQLNIQYSKKF